MPKRQLRDEKHLVDLYSISLRVWPTGKNGRSETRIVRHGKAPPRTVTADNSATLSRSILFSTKNKCEKPYHLRYSTRADGFIDNLKVNAVNEALPEERGRYDDYGNFVVFSFCPKPFTPFTMSFDVFGGFGRGNRNVHFHLPASAQIALLDLTLDLSAYERESGILFSPVFFFHADDPIDHDLCRLRGLGTPLQPLASKGAGVWQWAVPKISGGVVDVVWEEEPYEQEDSREAEAFLRECSRAALDRPFVNWLDNFVKICHQLGAARDEAPSLRSIARALRCHHTGLIQTLNNLEERLAHTLAERKGKVLLTSYGIMLYRFAQDYFRDK